MIFARNIHRPVRVRLIKFTVHVHHLRLYPDAKIHTEIVDFFTETSQPVRKLFRIHLPVSKRRTVIVPVTKPSIVHHKQFNPCFFSGFCELEQFFLIDIEIRSFPAIQQYRAHFFLPRTTHNMFPYKAVHTLAHPIVAGFGISHHCLRCLKAFPRRKLPAKILRIDSRDKPCFSIAVHFDRLIMVSAVYKIESIAVPGILRGLSPT